MKESLSFIYHNMKNQDQFKREVRLGKRPTLVLCIKEFITHDQFLKLLTFVISQEDLDLKETLSVTKICQKENRKKSGFKRENIFERVIDNWLSNVKIEMCCCCLENELFIGDEVIKSIPRCDGDESDCKIKCFEYFDEYSNATFLLYNNDFDELETSKIIHLFVNPSFLKIKYLELSFLYFLCRCEIKSLQTITNNKKHNKEGKEDRWKTIISEKHSQSAESGKINVKNFDSLNLENKHKNISDLKKSLDKSDSKEKIDNQRCYNDVFHQLLDMRFLRLNIPESLVYYFPDPPVNHIQNIPWFALNKEYLRLLTFSSYPLTCVKSSMLLAAAGFAYMGSGNNDLVICVFCGKQYQNWLVQDDIHTVHASLSPNCPMVTGNRCNNIPMNHLFSPSHSQDETFHQFQSLQVNEENRSSPTVSSASPVIPPSVNPVVPSVTIPTVPAATPMVPPSEAEVALPASESSTRGIRNVPAVADLPLVPAQYGEDLVDSPHEVNRSNRFENRIVESNSVNNSPLTTDSVPTPAPTSNSGNTSTSTSDAPPSFQQLGIIIERPKRRDLAHRASRLRTFQDWPSNHHLNVDDLTDAGFFFAGYGDCARCFFCGGGLRNWEINDNVWIEHARWFPRCTYIRYTRGQEFIDAIRRINDRGTGINISLQDVAREMYGTSAVELPLLTGTEDRIASDPAVRAVVEIGFDRQDVIQAAKDLRSAKQPVISDKIINKLIESGKQRGQPNESMSETVSVTRSLQRDEETMEAVRQSIQQLREQNICKVCLDKDVEVTFLPCGHCCCCMECSTAVDSCPVCQGGIRGVVKTYFE